MSSAPVTVEMCDVADGLWLWRQPHPAWEEGGDWEPEVASFAVESRGATLLLDPLAPPPDARDVWERIHELAPRRSSCSSPTTSVTSTCSCAGTGRRGAMETPLYLPEQRALVFADGLTAPGGELRV